MSNNTTTTIDWKTAKGWLKNEERQLLFDLATKYNSPEDLIINIGVEYGASLACLRAGAPNATVLGFDLDTSKVLELGYGAKLLEMSSYCEPAFIIARNLLATGKFLYLVFVDGDHSKDGVLHDAQYADMLEHGGYILFQDCWDWDAGIGVPHKLVPGVNQAVDEWAALPTTKKRFTELASVGTTRVFQRNFTNAKKGGR